VAASDAVAEAAGHHAADIVRRTAADIAFVSHPGPTLLTPNSAADNGMELRDYASLQIVSSQHLQIVAASFSQEW